MFRFQPNAVAQSTLLRAYRLQPVGRRAVTQSSSKSYSTAPTTSSVLPAKPATPIIPTGSALPVSPAPPPPSSGRPNRKSWTRRLLSPLVLLAFAFYGVSIPLGYFNLRYRDFLVESVPLGEFIGNQLDQLELNSGKAANLANSEQAKAAKQLVGAAPGTAAKKETELTRYAESKAKAEGWGLKKGGAAAAGTGGEKSASASDSGKVRQEVSEKAKEVGNSISSAAQAAKEKAVEQLNKVKDSANDLKQKATETLEEAKPNIETKAENLETKVKEKISDTVEKVKEIVPEAKSATRVEEPASTLPIFAQRPRDVDATPVPAKKAPAGLPYNGPPLPIGFEPAPGYDLPRAPKTPKGDLKPVSPPPAPLPLIAPEIAKDSKSTSEPILGKLAATIDNLAKFVETNSDNVSAEATSVLTSAQSDIKNLSERLESIKTSEEAKLNTSLKKQAEEYSNLLLKAEKDLVERLDTQEEDWKQAFDQERQSLVNAYKQKLDKELETQKEIIDQRLKEEVVAQGIELQRRWLKEVKSKVEQERGGRLSKLSELEGGLNKLAQVTQQNEESLSEAVRARKIFTAVKAVEHAVAAGKPFQQELNALKKLAKECPTPVIETALSSVDESVASTGVVSFPSLATRFTASVAPQLRRVSLFPEHGGLLEYLTSYVMSSFLFEKRGWAEGDDVISRVARANFHLANKDLDKAAKEVNLLKGWPKTLATDWLKQARSHLEVQMALDVAESEATAESLRSI